ncbi:hypothetical protein NRIC_04760 [Enterococcus florum]|uniref:Uncharacterized protein n=1 Tax=Enterococcus florum TaxID=2480627 RepID=A0A4P5P466_9ENTE|nr:hypothetical protein NRIC_04760 [Enterococcus florum]
MISNVVEKEERQQAAHQNVFGSRLYDCTKIAEKKRRHSNKEKTYANYVAVRK